MKNRGFTLIELVVGIAIASGLTAIAVPLYQSTVAKSQAAEAEKLINTERINIISNFDRGYCAKESTQALKGRFGVVHTSGAFSAKKGASCDSGCSITYTFNQDTQKKIAGKTVVVNVKLNGEISKSSLTTLPDGFISDTLNRGGTVNTGDDCTAISSSPPIATAAKNNAGTELGIDAPQNNGGGSTGGSTGGGGGSAGGSTGGGGGQTTAPPVVDTGEIVTPPPVTPPPAEPALPEVACEHTLFSAYKPHFRCRRASGGVFDIIGNTGPGTNKDTAYWVDQMKTFYGRFLLYGCLAEHSYTSKALYLDQCVTQRVNREYETKKVARYTMYRKKDLSTPWIDLDQARAR